LEASLTTAASRAAGLTGDQSAQGIVAAVTTTVRELRTTPTVGRIVVESDPTVLQVRPAQDLLLEPGDAIYMPKRPSTVAIAGEVLNATSVQFHPGATPADYIEQAGGFAQTADRDSVFVILPNGKAEPVKVSFWDYTSVQVPPGSTVVVPKDVTTPDTLTLTKALADIFGQLALAGASLAVISTAHP
jgi:protein involved in polysaccharide export with SLBB domain